MVSFKKKFIDILCCTLKIRSNLYREYIIWLRNKIASLLSNY